MVIGNLLMRKSDYGKHIIELVSQSLTEEFGRGFSETQVRIYRKFYLAFCNLLIQQTAPAEFKSKTINIHKKAEKEG